jgi:hypothetical protein
VLRPVGPAAAPEPAAAPPPARPVPPVALLGARPNPRAQRDGRPPVGPEASFGFCFGSDRGRVRAGPGATISDLRRLIAARIHTPLFDIFDGDARLAPDVPVADIRGELTCVPARGRSYRFLWEDRLEEIAIPDTHTAAQATHAVAEASALPPSSCP